MKAFDLVLLFLKKKIVLCFGHGPWGPHFLHKLGQKMVIFRGFSKMFLELLDVN